ncbi:MAG TPA: glycosyltransferase family 1 protein [Candidatus Angelobacter sp.]|nr:glycosyltransferase family 1 protein [Candidatus Angelobacter sp.]
MGNLRIALDPWVLAPRFRHQGTNVYARNLIAQFRKAAAQIPELEFVLFGPAQGFDAELSEPSVNFSFVSNRLVQHERLWRLGGANVSARRIGADVMFSPSCNIFPLREPPMVCTIHDATPFVMPSQSRSMVLAQRFFLRSAAQRSRAVITVSERSKEDLVETCNIPPEKITVVYNGYDQERFNEAPPDPDKLQALRLRLGLPRPYILHHGVVQPRKNLVRLIEAYQLLLSRRSDLELDLVLAGPAGWEHGKVVQAAKRCSSKRGQAVIPGMLGDDELALLLKGAAMVVIPSLYEGFCLPMVEAMACGIPAAVSNNSCFPEISGNALEYFDPQSQEDMAQKMESVLCDSELRECIRRRGLKRAADFSWERCGHETLNVLAGAVGRELRLEVFA